LILAEGIVEPAQLDASLHLPLFEATQFVDVWAAVTPAKQKTINPQNKIRVLMTSFPFNKYYNNSDSALTTYQNTLDLKERCKTLLNTTSSGWIIPPPEGKLQNTPISEN
jgi:hypothetical protein